MRLLVLLTISLSTFATLNAQKISYESIFDDIYNIYDHPYAQDPSIKKHNLYYGYFFLKYPNLDDYFGCDGEDCKNGKTYNKITFTLFGRKLYVSGKMKRKKGDPDYVQTKGPVRYVSNDQIYAEKINDDFTIPLSETIYQENGKPLIQSNPTGLGTQFYTTYSEDGSVDEQVHTYSVGSKFLTLYNENLNAISAKKNRDGSRYVGNGYFGMFTMVGGQRFTGFTKEISEGTVLLQEIPETNEINWVIVWQGAIVASYKAENGTKLSPVALSSAHNLITPEIGKNEKTSKPDTVTPKDDLAEGYLVKYAYKFWDSKEYDYEIGQFKNGKLNGVGVRKLSSERRINGRAYDTRLTENVEFGIFKDGNLVDGKTFSQDDVLPEKDLWSPVPKGISYRRIKPKQKPTYGKASAQLWLDDIKKGSQLFSPQLNRIFTAVSGSTETNELTFIGDDEAEVTVDATQYDFYVKHDVIGKPKCGVCNGDGFNYVNVYTTESRTHSYETGEMYVTDPRTGNLARGTTTYTANYDVRVKSGKEKKTCWQCNGAGELNKNSILGFIYAPIELRD